MSTTTPPTPDQWHEDYEDRHDADKLRAWLNGRGVEYFHLVEVEPVPYVFSLDPPAIESCTMTRITLERQVARGWAPYVGRPFHYEWPCAIDERGRAIAGRARIIYDEFREAIEFDAAAQDMLAITGAAVGQCRYCGSYRADGLKPLVHEPACPLCDPRFDPIFRGERAKPTL